MVQCHETFLRWAKGEGIIEKDGNNDKAEQERKRRRKKDNDVEVRGSRGYQVAKIPGYRNVTVDALINKFHATDKHFLWYLEEFLFMHSFPIPLSHDVPFGIFKRLSVMLPQIPQVTDLTDLRDTIRTTLPEPAQDRRKAIPAQFDTVLAFEKPGLTVFLDPSNPLKGVYYVFLINCRIID
jgi:hypothetical protein